MVRIRIRKGLKDLSKIFQTYEKHAVNSKTSYYSKNIGSIQIQVKLKYPGNVRIKDWDDNRAPWIFLKALLEIESSGKTTGKIKVLDEGQYRILEIEDVLNTLEELSKYTDIAKRLTYWYNQYLEGKIKI